MVSNISTKHIDKVKTEHMHFLRCSEEDLSDLVSSRGLVPAGKWVRKKWLTELSGVLRDKGGLDEKKKSEQVYFKLTLVLYLEN